MNVGILISGRGSNMMALADAVAEGRVPGARIVLVVSDRPQAAGLGAARERGIETAVVERRGRTREEHEREIINLLHRHGVELVCLAGYMRLLSPCFVEEFRGRLLNIHPSLLPAFPGLDAQRQAVEHGVRVSGPRGVSKPPPERRRAVKEHRHEAGVHDHRRAAVFGIRAGEAAAAKQRSGKRREIARRGAIDPDLEAGPAGGNGGAVRRGRRARHAFHLDERATLLAWSIDRKRDRANIRLRIVTSRDSSRSARKRCSASPPICGSSTSASSS